MSMSFCLLSEPWIPCVRPSGEPCQLSLTEALLQASTLAEVYDPSPLVTVALHRLMLAVLSRALQPLNEADWVRLWRQGTWPEARLRAYLETWASRFDLFDPQWPFYQVAGLPERLSAPVSRLSQPLASGMRATLFDHTLDGSAEPVSASEAARLLVAYHPFCLSGRLGTGTGWAAVRSGHLANAAVFLPTGATLFETLMLNLLPTDLAETGQGPCLPAWERTTPTIHAERVPEGYADLLTWQSRRVWLEPVSGGGERIEVKRVIVCGGWEMSRTGLVSDAMLAYECRRPGGRGGSEWTPLPVPRPGSWWQLRAALLTRCRRGFRPPATLLWIAELAACGILPPDYGCQLSVFGLKAYRARIDAWGHDRQQLPVRYLQDSDLAADLERCLEVADATGMALERALAAAAVRPPGQTTGADRTGRGPQYWGRIQALLPRLLCELPGDVQHRDAVLLWWAETCAQTAWEVFHEFAADQALTVRTLPQLVRAGHHLASGLWGRALRPYRGRNHSETFRA